METGKVPREVGEDFLKQVARVGAKIKAGDLAGALEEYGTLLRALELPCRPDGHRGRFIRKGEADFNRGFGNPT